MSVQRDTVVMVCAEVPRRLWVRDNPAAPGYTTCVLGFYEQHEEMIVAIDEGQPGAIGILYDGMDTNYCWFGVLIAAERAYDQPKRDMSVSVGATALQNAQDLVAVAFERRFQVPPDSVQLRIIAHYH